ncbi:MAG: TetR/AcrR family transcriptional regulator [Acidobacteriota bacterium]
MTDTRTRILNLAEGLTQTHGFNGFSYLDLANEIGVKHSSIHYHFKSKADLALALVTRIQENHTSAFADLDAAVDTPQERLRSLIEFFQGYVRENKFCMCGMMSAELRSVSDQVRNELVVYFTDFQSRIAKQFSEMGHDDPQGTALRFLSALEGSLLLARLRNDPDIVSNALNPFVSP